MEITVDTPFTVGFLVGSLRPPTRSLTIVVKATFAIVPDGVCALASEQPPCTGEAYPDDDPERAPRHDTDLAIYKPRGECFLAGTCHPPGGRAKVSAVAFGVGSVKKALAIFGDRDWSNARLGVPEPAPFESMPLCWERSFGGRGHDPNPVGVGVGGVEGPAGERRPLPNIENPDDLVSSPASRPAPAGCFPIPFGWKPRLKKAGTYDARWLETRWPFFAEDLDLEIFNAAPEDQRIAGYWTGDEEIALRNLLPGHSLVNTRLPSLGARAFVVRHASPETLAEVPLRLDTIRVDSDAGTVVCLWRGLTEVAGDKLEDLARLFVVHDRLTEQRSVEALAERLAWLTGARAAELASLEGEPPPSDTIIDPFAAPEPPEPPRTVPPADPVEEGMAELERRLAAAGFVMPAVDPGPPPDAARLRELAAKLVEAQVATPDQIEELARTAEAPATAAEPPPAPAPTPLRQQVQDALAEGRSLRGTDLTDADLSGLELGGADLTGAILTRANLRAAVLDGALLDEATCGEIDLAGASLVATSLRRTDLHAATGRGARFDRALLDGADLSAAQLSEASFEGASCVAARFEGATLSRARFHGATLRQAELGGAVLEQANLTGACLEEARLEGVEARELIADGCDLTALRASEGASFVRASFRQAKAPRSRWSRSVLDEAYFDGVELERADFTGASLVGAKMSSCNAARARFQDARLRGLGALRTNFFEASFEAADLADCDLRGSNLFGAELWQARTEGTQLDQAVLTRTKLERR